MIAARLLRWFATHGRHDLPWQVDSSPYRVWLSEIMLQQTRVSTVIPYFQRFVGKFPDVHGLARADLDQVLHLWSGLGYYARARNLHKTARIVSEEYDGLFPAEADALLQLPGIGRSTAGAILALGFGQRAVILDGNVKRVLARCYAVAGWPGQTRVANELWRLAERNTPESSVADYTQAIMDLGATVCQRTRPRCDSCPLSQDCIACRNEQQHLYPEKRPGKRLPVRETIFAMVRDSTGAVLLQQNPPTGIWGGLWCFPRFNTVQSLQGWLDNTFETDRMHMETGAVTRHTFSHFHLDITPVRVNVAGRRHTMAEEQAVIWYQPGQGREVGLAAPVTSLLAQLTQTGTG